MSFFGPLFVRKKDLDNLIDSVAQFVVAPNLSLRDTVSNPARPLCNCFNCSLPLYIIRRSKIGLVPLGNRAERKWPDHIGISWTVKELKVWYYMTIIDWATFQLVDYITTNQISDFVALRGCRSSRCHAIISQENSWGVLCDISISGCRGDYQRRCHRHLGAGNPPGCLDRRYCKMTMSMHSPSNQMQLVKLHIGNLNFWTSSPFFNSQMCMWFSIFTKYGSKILVLRNLNLSDFPEFTFQYTVSLWS